jgi:filamentous hemagglutinin family protein
VLIPRVAQQLHDQLRTARVIGSYRRKTDEGLGEGTCAIAASWQRRVWQLGVALALGLSGAIAFSRDSALAQITPDLTLGGERSRVAPRVVNGIPSDVIYGGAARGSTLFHSFSQFNVAPRQGAFFINPVGIENILSRVTGISPSNILGTLGVLGNANLFLINPNGIIFGSNARLNLNGSFVATTANGIGLDNQTIFSASPANPPPSTLLAINPSAFFFNQIGNQSNGPILVNQGAVLSVGNLRTPRSLLLVGGNVLVDGATLQGFDGSQIQVAGFTGTGNVGLTVNGNNLSLALPGTGVAGANVWLTNGALINVGSRTTNAGDILLAGSTLALLDGSQLSTSTFGVGNAGNVRLLATDSVFIDNSTIFSRAVDGSSGNAGNVVIAATQGSVLLNNSTLTTTNFSSGLAGDISITAANQVSISNSGIFSRGDLGRIFIGESQLYSSLSPQIIAIDNSTLNASVPQDFSGNAGGIFLNGGSIFLTDSKLDSNNFASGIAGRIIINARDLVSLVNSEITSQSENDNSSEFGFISLLATEGSVVLNNSLMSTTNFGSGYAGDISISASDRVAILNSNIFSQGYLGRIFISKSDEYASFSPEIIRIENSQLRTNNLNSGQLAGDVNLDAINNIFISSSNLSSTASGAANAGSIVVRTNGLISLDRSEISTNNMGSGIAGNIILRARDQISVFNSKMASESTNDNTSEFGFILLTAPEGAVLLNNSNLSTTNFGSGYAGDIRIRASEQVSILNQSHIISQGYLGIILIEASQGSFLLGESSRLSTTNFGDSLAGDISISARDQVSILDSGIFSRGNLGRIFIGASKDYSSFSPQRVIIDNSTLNTNNSSFEGAEAVNAGGISIQANDVVALTNGTEVTSSTLRTGDAGAVLVRTNGGFVLLNNSNIFSTVERGGVGDGGNIRIETGSLYLRNGSQLQTLVRGISNEGTPAGQGNAGRITVIADDIVTVSGRNSNGFPSAIFSNVQFGTQENSRGGDVTITARSLYINNGGQVSVDNTGLGPAGNINITVREDLFLENQGFLRATTSFGQGGNIYLTIGDFLVLTQNSGMSTEAGRALGAGDGGNIDINIGNPRARAIFAAPSNDNNIQANAFLGNGGNIRVNVGYLYDIDRRLLDPGTNDINASSTYGRQGQVNINELEIDPYAGLNNLPVETIDSSGLIAQNCPARGRGSAQEENKFIVTGRGGLPPNPNDTLQAESVVTNWVTIDPQVENRTENVTSGNPNPDTPAQTSVLKPPALVEAQGWIIGQKGEIILTAQAPKVTPHNPSLLPTAICNGS